MRRISGDAVKLAVLDEGAGSPVQGASRRMQLDAPERVNELLLELLA